MQTSCTRKQSLEEKIYISVVGIDEFNNTLDLEKDINSNIYKAISDIYYFDSNIWEPYFVTQIGKGILVRSEKIQLQFIDNSLFYFSENDAYVTRIDKNKYKELLKLLKNQDNN